MIIGITGTDGAGKGTAVEYLCSKGFVHYHARKLFEEEIKKQGLENNRANMRVVGNQMRAEHGDDVIVQLFLKQAAENGHTHIIIDSIRAVAEADTLKICGGVLLSLDADRKVRYERIVLRGSSSDQVSFEEFLLLEEREMNDTDPHGLQKAKVMQMADYTIENNTSLNSLHANLNLFLQKFNFIL